MSKTNKIYQKASEGRKGYRIQRRRWTALKYRRPPLMIKPSQPPLRAKRKTGQPGFARRKCIPPLVPSVPPSHPRFGRATKGKRLYGQARRLTSPDLHILCRMCTVGLWTLGIVPHVSVGKHIAVYSAPCIGWQRNWSYTSELDS